MSECKVVVLSLSKDERLKEHGAKNCDVRVRQILDVKLAHVVCVC